MGGKWKKRYLVCPIEAFEKFSFRAASMGQSHHVNQHIATTMKLEEMIPVYYPFADAYFHHNYTLRGRMDAFLHETDDSVPDPQEGLADTSPRRARRYRCPQC